jgi:hypothetical protein
MKVFASVCFKNNRESIAVISLYIPTKASGYLACEIAEVFVRRAATDWENILHVRGRE